MITSAILNLRKLAPALCAVICAGTAAAKTPLVAKWGRFEQSFKSSVEYQNPFQQCTLQVRFISPSRRTNSVYGFWDGGRTWRVRFSPNEPGRWTYETSCSDEANKRLNQQTGEFLCTAPTGQNRFEQHGPVQVARDRHHFEQADGTPFFWAADVAWNAPRLSTSRDWITYTQVRGGQNFSAVEWAASPGKNAKGHSAFSDESRSVIDPEYFRELDNRIEMMNRAGLLSVIAPLWREKGATNKLPDEQAELLVRYMVARWGAYDVAWLLTADDNQSQSCLRIGRDVFGETTHAPVIVFPGVMASSYDEFQNEDWVDAFGFGLGQNVNNNSLKWLVSGPVGREWRAEPGRPMLNVLPPLENGFDAEGQKRIEASDARRVAWWSALLTPCAGMSYGAQDVAAWNAARQQKLPAWQISLFLPGAKDISRAAQFFTSTDYTALRPAPRSMATQPGYASPDRYIAATETASGNLIVAYIPEDRTLDLYLNILPLSPEIQWFNPRTGKKSPAVAVIGTQTCQLPTPEPGDWVLVVKSRK